MVLVCFMTMLGCNLPTFNQSNNVDLLFWETVNLQACPTDESIRLGLMTDGQEYWIQCLDYNTRGPRGDNCRSAITGWNNRN